MARGGRRAKCVWAHGYSGPTIGIGGRTRPVAGDTKDLSPSTFSTQSNSLNFLHVGLCVSFSFASNVAHRGASNLMRETTRVDQVDVGPPDLDHTRVTISQPSF